MKTIAVVAGGDSSEYQISVKSGKSVAGIISSLYRVYLIIIRGSNWYWEDPKGRYHTVDKNNFTLKADDLTIRFDAVFIAIHGKPGENGMLQGYFDMLQIPYTGSSSFCSALTFNKHACKLFLKEYNIGMAESIFLRKNEKPDNAVIVNKLGLPCFVKPNDSGSSFGVSKVRQAGELADAISEAFRESDEILIESFMQGREVACGLVMTKSRKIILPLTEIISKNEFFDFEAKYTPGKSDEITPADLPEKLTDEIRKLSSRIADLLGCSGIVRVDFIIVGNKPLFLEINTVPGMTEESIIPKQAAAAGIPLKDLYSMVIEDLFV
ncbi:MAG TPA: D-alanine--D-alanine ligase [Bacteroidales bacterium]|jgi:D-alanine-D-alanine ligase|nr:D-alanine--D-alanine ligase [Bacteroidales bacterium]HOS71815.1 D-alanine--D-alanine ligase [Bacteroidales bacterium]HQH24162.1 D-alanine--D-alanine ligase [Bacteroidales bacterium]HQJ81786.1 D-alanine--D-alanine ligase [Bacteroidales bacterium]